MPWYISPVKTCKVLNRIAARYQRANLQDLKSTLDNATQLIWSKQERFCSRSSSAKDVSGINGIGF